MDDATPSVVKGTNLLAYFGQHFDHGIGFIAKGQSGSVAIGSPAFPISTSRSNIVTGTGIDPEGIPGNGDEVAARCINNTSPFVGLLLPCVACNQFTHSLLPRRPIDPKSPGPGLLARVQLDKQADHFPLIHVKPDRRA